MTPAVSPGGCKALPYAPAQGDGILIVDANLVVIQANTQIQALFCARQEELLGADALDVIQRYLLPLLPEGGSSGEVAALLHDGSSPQPVMLEIRVPRLGVRRMTVTASRVDAVTPALRLLIFHDIGDEDADTADRGQVGRAEGRFRSIFTTSHAVMLIIDPDTGAIVDANPAASAYYGYPLRTLRTMRIAEINAIEQEDLFREMQKAVTGEKQHFTFLHRLADGRCRDVDVFSGHVVIGGRVLLHSIIHDVTDRWRAEAQFRALLDATPDAAMLIDHDGILLALNEVMAARFGKTVSELLGVCAYDLFPPELAARRRDLTAQALAMGKPLRHIDERDGRIFENVLFPIPDGREGGRRVAIISRDITHEREFERTRQDAFDRIRQNIEQFAILGDHIRQPLQVILGTACLLEDEQAVGKIQQGVEQINGYIRQLDQGWIHSRMVGEYLRRHERL